MVNSVKYILLNLNCSLYFRTSVQMWENTGTPEKQRRELEGGFSLDFVDPWASDWEHGSCRRLACRLQREGSFICAQEQWGRVWRSRGLTGGLWGVSVLMRREVFIAETRCRVMQRGCRLVEKDKPPRPSTRWLVRCRHVVPGRCSSKWWLVAAVIPLEENKMCEGSYTSDIFSTKQRASQKKIRTCR